MRIRKSRGFLRIAPITLSLVMLTACGGGPMSPSMRLTQAYSARIVSISPSVTEILYGVGGWSQVIAVSQYCTYPDDVINKPRVSGWGGTTNLEQVTELKPDLVIGVDAQESFIKDKLDAIGVRSLFVKSQGLADIFVAIDEIGNAVGHGPDATELIARIKNEIFEVQTAVKNRQRPQVLCVVDRTPGTLRDIYVATQGSFLTELIRIAGGEPIAPAAATGYGMITKEALLTLDPDVIIEMQQGAKGKLGEDPGKVWRQLSEVRAVKDGRIYSVQEKTAIHPSQFIGRTARLFAQYIHPEAFGDVSDKNR